MASSDIDMQIQEGQPSTVVSCEPASSKGLTQYYQHKLDSLQSIIREKSSNLRRLEAQRAILNLKGV
jgi:hypothetical protein